MLYSLITSKLYLCDHKCPVAFFSHNRWTPSFFFELQRLICETFPVHRRLVCPNLFSVFQICVLSSNHIIISFVPKRHNRMITSHLPNISNNALLDILNFSIYICAYFTFHCCLWFNFCCSNLRNVVTSLHATTLSTCLSDANVGLQNNGNLDHFFLVNFDNYSGNTCTIYP